MKPGENLEHLVHVLEHATNANPGVKVESRKRLPDRDTGHPREHDVVITFSLNHHTIVMALECKDRSRPVGVPDVEGFRKKCDRTGVDKAIMVSSTGFRKTALKKAEAMDIGCLALHEVDGFDWCLAPGVEFRERDLLQGPHWEIRTAQEFKGDLQVFDQNGDKVDHTRASNIAFSCLNGRPAEIAQQQDVEAETQPVTCSFNISNASDFYLIDSSGTKVPLTAMFVHVTYKVRCSLLPFDFRQYIDCAKGKQLYSVAFVAIDKENMKGDLILHRSPEEIRLSFVPKQ